MPAKVFESKVKQVLEVLSKTQFHQCMVFVTLRGRTDTLCDALCEAGWPAAAMSGMWGLFVI